MVKLKTKKSEKKSIGDFFITAEEYFLGLLTIDSRELADEILRSLLEKKLIFMGIINKGLAYIPIQTKIRKKFYYSISIFTLGKNRDKIISIVDEMIYKLPITLTFYRVDKANLNFMNNTFNINVCK